MVCIDITEPNRGTTLHINYEYQHHQFHAIQSPSLFDNAVDHCVLSGANNTNDVDKVFMFVFVFEADPVDGEEGGGVNVSPSSTLASLSVLLLVERTLLPLPPPPPLLSLISIPLHTYFCPPLGPATTVDKTPSQSHESDSRHRYAGPSAALSPTYNPVPQLYLKSYII